MLEYSKNFEDALNWIRKIFPDNINLELVVGNYEEEFFDVSFKDSCILINEKLFEWKVKKMISLYKKEEFDENDERTAMLVHEIVEWMTYQPFFITKYSHILEDIYPFWMHEFANYVEDKFRKEKNLPPDYMHTYSNELKEKFGKILKSISPL
jgi:hypothetical protein